MDFPNIWRKLWSFFGQLFWFLVLDRKICDNSKIEFYFYIDLVFYDNSLLIEFTNTIYSQIHLLKVKKKKTFNSDSGMPLEQKSDGKRITFI